MKRITLNKARISAIWDAIDLIQTHGEAADQEFYDNYRETLETLQEMVK